MEPAVGEVWSSSQDGSNLLGLPGPCPWEDDEEPLGLGGIKPKSSPIPRRRSSASSCSDDDSQPPPSSSRRVSFADAFGLSLVSIKQFDSWAPDPLEADLNEVKEYFLSQLFILPATPEELAQKVQENKLELESLEILPGTTTLKGIIRVLNLCFDKLVFIRTSLDCWSSHFDLLAEYVPGSSNSNTDCFSFRLTLVPPFGKQGARVDFCLRYETPFGTFWANNSGQNYVLFCHEKAKEDGENEKKHRRKSCLKSTSYDYSSETSSTSSTEEIPEIILNCGTAAVTEPVAVKKGNMQEEHMKLEEENIRNRSRRCRRKAARLEKVRQYFAEREENGLQQINKHTSEAAAKTNMEKPVPEKVEAPLNLSAPQENVWTETMDSISPSPADAENNSGTPDSVNADSKQITSRHIQTQDKEDIPVMHSELTASLSHAALSPVDPVNCHKSSVSSASQEVNNSQDKETLTGQTVSITQQLFECQNSEPSFSKSVEKAWECFEKGAIERIGSAVDTTSSRGEENHTVILECSPDSQPFGHNFTFETVVAPLYHQVFERMETERRDQRSRELDTGRAVEKLEDGCLRRVTYQDDDEEEEVKEKDTELYMGKGKDDVDHLSLELETEEQERVSRVTSVATAESVIKVDSFKSRVHLRQEQKSTARTSEEGSMGGEEEIPLDSTGSLQQTLTGNSGVKLSEREEGVCCQIEKQQAAEGITAGVNTLLENPEDISAQGENNMGDSASTESLTDDEMDLYLHRLKSTQQPGFRDTTSSGSYSKRPSSVSRTRTMPSPMPSISESLNEDQPNASLEDLTKEEDMELEKATLPLSDAEEEVIGRNVLWWREFFSSENMSRMMGYMFLLGVFLVTAHYYDFIACFVLYLLALYWLYFRGESEPSEVTQPTK
ncbi:hypothetical protein SRHO_G00118860 [Serrasalmus rhombeus]